MKTLTAKDAKYGFGRLIDLARAEPVAKHGRPVVVVMAVEEFERLKAPSVAHAQVDGWILGVPGLIRAGKERDGLGASGAWRSEYV